MEVASPSRLFRSSPSNPSHQLKHTSLTTNNSTTSPFNPNSTTIAMSSAGWTCPNTMGCRNKGPNLVSSTVCLHCGRKFGTPFSVTTAEDAKKASANKEKK